MPKFITVTTFYEQHPELMKQELGVATRDGHQDMGELWRDQLVGEHFDERARLVFGYQARRKKYLGFKKAMARLGKVEDGGEVDLVFSGLFRRMVLSMSIVAATPNKTTITHFVPSYVSGRPPKPRSPSLRKELLTISPRQEKLLGEAGERGFVRRLGRIRALKVTRTN